MIDLDFKNKRVTVMGLGLHGGGLAVTKFLAQKGAILTVTDLKSQKQLAQSIKELKNYKIKYVLGKHQLADFINADMIIKNPGVPRNSKFLLAAQKRKVPIETDLSLFFQLCPAENIIGITGTKGKSTTTSLIYKIIKSWKKDAILGGNIRISPLDFLPKIKKETPVILELSSWQLEGLADRKISPPYALITNVLRDHLNTYNNMADYANAKSLIYRFQKSEDYLILNKQSEFTRKMAPRARSKVYWFCLEKLNKKENGAFLEKNWLVFQEKGKKTKIIKSGDIQLAGAHNLANILAAICLVKIFKVPDAIIRDNIKNFKGIEGRLEFISQCQGIKYYNDTTATTPDAVSAALNSFDQKVVLLAGGTDKKLDFKELAKKIKEKTKSIILFEGTATEKLVKELRSINYNENIVFVDSMKEAFKQAKYILKKGDIFLLSPGAASFGLFINEFDRGEQFNQAVKKLS
ncbi:MAG: UDP-N-acetylmuramoylalanine--D-glutamate ligase [Candidatus Buchananbacteria bacterium RBG_13_36_9]|uniref:UDP-N-acetylmuramoylalanine--D-glutamate ligase n=1 Tax=Candidatus Buchananbacteria bacterium RBG_13_36_9 TaxID=1797530 RepID=A0A1G1XM99_9BACT|nr:MAG: UDP-N-acetylmuramoylalanine--D-glutamate ligase [Candidatus Buchananbacteria bacterium RBG_13_36_9]